MKYPVILVLSEEKLKSMNVINNIRKVPEDEDNEVLMSYSNQNIIGYILNLTTKYYKTSLYLVPFEDDIDLVPSRIKENIECVLIYFDAGKRSFSKRIPLYAKFVKENFIELGILLCDKLYDNSNEGITYSEAKQESRFLDVIELDRKHTDEDDNDPHDPLGYDEVLQALRSSLWSNANVNAVDNQKFENEQTSNTNEGDECKNNPCSVEEELEVFEKLLLDVMDFKNSSASLSRNERLAQMEKFANKFECLVNENSTSSEDEN